VDLPALLIPLEVGNGEQRLNAERLVASHGAKVLANEELTGARLLEELSQLAAIARHKTSSTTRESAADRLAEIIIEVLDHDQRRGELR
jgi:UDP-N-acetylglucosamine--N-acetylmuramyl-(pentapeptide) pyrophosphoryl-undecaprenol N-acetylglucosamine transferase